MQIRDTGRFDAAFGALVIVAATSSCTSDTVRTDFDPTANFGHYRTYGFVPGTELDASKDEVVFAHYMVEAISIEMEKRGYVRSSDPDLLINYRVKLREKSAVTATYPSISYYPPTSIGPYGAPFFGYYGYRGGYIKTWPGNRGYQYAQVLRYTYTEGIFNIDLVDARTMRLVWGTVGEGEVSQEDLGKIADRVYEGVPQYFAKFPFTAGSGLPQKR